MISGYNNSKCLTDIKYNITEEDIKKIALTKKSLSSEIKRLRSVEGDIAYQKKKALSTILSNFETMVLPSIYNSTNGYDIQSSFHKLSSGEDQEELKEISKLIDIASSYAKYEDGSILQKSISSLYNQFGGYSNQEVTEQEIQQEQEAISRCTKDIENNESEENKPNDNPMKDMIGYKLLEEWLKKMKGSDTKKKKYQQISKMSDLQRVSSVEFIRPKALLMKKIVNKELYCKQIAESERYMHIMTDRSGSMGDYNTWRNLLLEKTYNDCVNMNINVSTEFWNTDIYTSGVYSPQKIKSKEDLKNKALMILPNGSDRMGYCVLRKLNTLERKKSKQYILCISDGTGSIDDAAQRKYIYSLAESKNIEIKFALFSRNNDMCGTPKEDIFYIYS